MAEADGQEKTEEPTPKKLNEAREKGQVPRSRELSTVAALLAAAAAFIIIGDDMMNSLSQQLRHGLTLSREQVFDTKSLPTVFVNSVVEAVMTLLPFFVLMVVVAVVAAIALGGLSFSSEALSFKWEKLDPIKGMGRVFSWRGIIEMLKGFAKFVLVALVALLLLDSMEGRFIGLGSESLTQALAHTGSLLSWSFLLLSATLLLVAAIDVPFQLWDTAASCV